MALPTTSKVRYEMATNHILGRPGPYFGQLGPSMYAENVRRSGHLLDVPVILQPAQFDWHQKHQQ